MNPTNISWTNYTWNPIVGCSKISAGCANCYAEEVATRYGFTQLKWTKKNDKFNVKIKRDRLSNPEKVKTPQLVFTCSMSDMFHEKVSYSYIYDIFKTMADIAPQHTYQVLTKRIEKGKTFIESLDDYPENVWIGTSVENKDTLHRIDTLRNIDNNIPIRFLSCEPLLEDLGILDLQGIDWVIIGGESGKNFRPMQMNWVRNIRDQCIDNQIPLFYKQTSGYKPNMKPYILETDKTQTIYQQMPVGFQHFISEKS